MIYESIFAVEFILEADVVFAFANRVLRPRAFPHPTFVSAPIFFSACHFRSPNRFSFAHSRNYVSSSISYFLFLFRFSSPRPNCVSARAQSCILPRPIFVSASKYQVRIDEIQQAEPPQDVLPMG